MRRPHGVEHVLEFFDAGGEGAQHLAYVGLSAGPDFHHIYNERTHKVARRAVPEVLLLGDIEKQVGKHPRIVPVGHKVQRVETVAVAVVVKGRELEHRPMPGSPPCGLFVDFALGVEDEDRAVVVQGGRQDKALAFTSAGGCDGKQMPIPTKCDLAKDVRLAGVGYAADDHPVDRPFVQGLHIAAVDEIKSTCPAIAATGTQQTLVGLFRQSRNDTPAQNLKGLVHFSEAKRNVVLH